MKKSVLLFAFFLSTLFGSAQDEAEETVSPVFFRMHVPIMFAYDQLREKVITNGHKGGLGLYVDVGDYRDLSAGRAFFSNGVQTYAILGSDPINQRIDKKLMIDDIVHTETHTQYKVSTETGVEPELVATFNFVNKTPDDGGPALDSVEINEEK